MANEYWKCVWTKGDNYETDAVGYANTGATVSTEDVSVYIKRASNLTRADVEKAVELLEMHLDNIRTWLTTA